MSGSKATVGLIATLMFLSIGVVLYPQGVRSQAPYSTPTAPDRYCAKPVGALEPPDCTFSLFYSRSEGFQLFLILIASLVRPECRATDSNQLERTAAAPRQSILRCPCLAPANQFDCGKI